MKNVNSKGFGKGISPDVISVKNTKKEKRDSSESEESDGSEKSQMETDDQILAAYNEIVTVKPNSLKISINKKQAFGGGTDRKSILEHIRSSTNLFTKFTDAQLLYITDPECILKANNIVEPNRVEFLMKHAVFKNFEGKFSKSTLQKIKQTFS